MRKHLQAIKKALDDHQQAAEQYETSVNVLHTLLGEHGSALKGAGASNSSVAGYLGHLSKITGAHKNAVTLMLTGNKALHDGLHKCVDGIAKALNVDVRDRSNANADEAGGTTGTHDGQSLEGTPVEHGFKAVSMTGKELDALSKTVGRPTLFSKVQGIVNVRPNQRLAKCETGGWRPMAQPDHFNGHPSTLSEYEKRKLKQ